MGQTRAAELKQFQFAQLGSRFHDHQPFRDLAPFVIRDGDDGSLIDVGMCRQSFLHLERGNVFAATHDDVFAAINNEDVAVLVKDSHVSGVKPSTAQGLGAGWFHTGDMAVLNEDGYILIVDRRKDIIVSGGENISSLEVEKALAAHPNVYEAA